MSPATLLPAASGIEDSRLFKPVKIGNMTLKHRVGMCPMTRLRGTDARVPTAVMKEHYSQRCAVPGTLIISEGIIVTKALGGGFIGAPGLWNDEQVEAWKPITEEVHSKGCFIVAQLFGFGRGAPKSGAASEGVEVVGPSAIPIDGDDYAVPRPMTIEEVQQTVREYTHAAKNAIAAGFDAVELHVANGYLHDQFLQDTANQRTDQYGGSVENRSRFIHETLQQFVEAVGAERVGMRLSPWSRYQQMGMKDPIPQFTDIIRKAADLNLAYLSVVEARVDGAEDSRKGSAAESIDFAYDAWSGPMLVAGGFGSENARRTVDKARADRDVVVLFGRWFISNPDLVYRLQNDLPLAKYDRGTFYQRDANGYVDYPASDEWSKNAEFATEAVQA